MTTLKILTAARELLSDEKRWTRAAPAKSLSGRPCYSRSRRAVCWCVLGAIARAAKRDKSGAIEAGFAIQCVAGKSIVKFNDDPATTHAMILDAFDSAIEKARVNE